MRHIPPDERIEVRQAGVRKGRVTIINFDGFTVTMESHREVRISGAGVPATADQIKIYVADPNTEGITPGDVTAGAIAVPQSGAGPWFSWSIATATWL